jgi:hypothetical protein
MPTTTSGQNALLTSGKGGFSHVGALTGLISTETSGGSYARQALTTGAAASGQASNSGSLSVPIAAGQTIVALSLHDAISAGNLLAYLPYGSSGQVLQGVGTVDVAASDTFKSAAHGLATDDRVFFSAVNNESLPAGLSASTLYFVRSAGLTADVFTVATTSGGAAVDITGLGEAAWFKTVPNTFASAGNLSIATSALVLDARFV